jgi:hypothetical protein
LRGKRRRKRRRKRRGEAREQSILWSPFSPQWLWGPLGDHGTTDH